MNRKEFISTCGKGCLVVLGAGFTFMQGCAGGHYITAQLSGADMIVPTSAFETEKNGTISFKRYVIAHHDKLEYPICIYRLSASDYHALWMRCTHQGTELQVFGDRLQCPAHGSEFSMNGSVQNGPAENPLRTFAVSIEKENLKIRLS